MQNVQEAKTREKENNVFKIRSTHPLWETKYKHMKTFEAKRAHVNQCCFCRFDTNPLRHELLK